MATFKENVIVTLSKNRSVIFLPRYIFFATLLLSLSDCVSFSSPQLFPWSFNPNSNSGEQADFSDAAHNILSWHTNKARYFFFWSIYGCVPRWDIFPPATASKHRFWRRKLWNLPTGQHDNYPPLTLPLVRGRRRRGHQLWKAGHKVFRQICAALYLRWSEYRFHVNCISA